ncbi:MAG: hypothetical protein REI93_11775, partial [Pedobacter sp.]|nr:hypothetical protein [Pedobacter sp.]
MKNLLRFSLLVAILFTAASVYAYDENFALKVKSTNQKSIVFYVQEKQDVSFSIYGADNEVLYVQQIHAEQAAAKTYNLEAFPDGNYKLRLETDQAVTEYQIEILDGKTIVQKPTITQKFKPVLIKENATIKLNIENSDKAPVEIVIVNENNNQLYSDVLKDSANVSKVFNVS